MHSPLRHMNWVVSTAHKVKPLIALSRPDLLFVDPEPDNTEMAGGKRLEGWKWRDCFFVITFNIDLNPCGHWNLTWHLRKKGCFGNMFPFSIFGVHVTFMYFDLFWCIVLREPFGTFRRSLFPLPCANYCACLGSGDPGLYGIDPWGLSTR